MKKRFENISKVFFTILKAICILGIIYYLINTIVNWNNGISLDNRSIEEIRLYLEQKIKEDYQVEVELKFKSQGEVSFCSGLDIDQACFGKNESPKKIHSYTFTGVNKNNEKQKVTVRFTGAYKYKWKTYKENIIFEIS